MRCTRPEHVVVIVDYPPLSPYWNRTTGVCDMLERHGQLGIYPGTVRSNFRRIIYTETELVLYLT